MKKFMILATVAVLSLASQAAAVTWSSSAISFNGTKLGGLSVDLYIVGVNGAADALFDTRTTTKTPAIQAGKLGDKAGTVQDAYKYTSTVAGGALWNADSGDLGREYYMVIKYTSNGTEYTYTSSAVASSGLSDTALGSVAFTFKDTIGTAGAKDAWVASTSGGDTNIPEPTSGLLMLVGGALLALRRKRA